MRKALLILAAAALWACAAPGGQNAANSSTSPPDPTAVVRPLYDRYIRDAGFPAFEDSAPWTDETRAAILAMEARSEALQEPILDFDPMIGAQDHEIGAVAVETVEAPANGRAVVAARFANGGRDTIIFYDLKLVEGAWRVDNIRDECWSMRAILAAQNDEQLRAAENGDCPP